ncbi:MAG: AMP-binding protein [Acidobacteriaceae bacterium]
MRPHLATLVDDLRRNGAQTAIVCYRGVRCHATTYAELATLAARFSAEILQRGICPGERIVLWGENSAEWVGAFFGCLLRGVLVVPLDAAGSPDFAARIIADVAPRLILADATRLPWLRSTTPYLPLENLAAHLPAEPLFAVDPAVQLDAPFQIIFTSGTTSTPKGIVHTHRNVLASLDPIEREMQKYLRYERLFHPLRFLHTLPLSHVFGQFMGLWTPPLLAAELHLDPHLEPARLLDRIRLNRISVLIAVPRSLELLRSHLKTLFPNIEAQLAASAGWPVTRRMLRFRHVHRSTGWKFWALISGGGTLPPDLELFWGRLGYAVIQGYGMTETAALITLNHPFHLGKGTLGKPLPGREVKISPQGEILVRGDVVAGSTWVQGRIQPRTSDWLATGDLAIQEDSGELRFAGRRSDVIVTSAGLNIYPADLEAALLQQPGVRSAAVVKYEGPNGPEPVAVLLAEGDASHLRHVLQQANQQLATFQQMRHVLRWLQPSFPYTSTGKLLRRVVAEWAGAQLSASASNPAPVPGDPLLEMIASISGEPPAGTTDSAHLAEDLHLDSLARVQLQSLLEQRFGIELEEEQIAQAVTLGDLRAITGSPSPPAPQPSAQNLDQDQDQARPRPSTQLAAPNPAPAITQDAAPVIPAPTVKASSPPSTALPHRYPRWTWLAPINLLRAAFLELVVRPLVWFLAAPRVERSSAAGAQPQQPMLIIANHITAYDVPLVLYGLPAHLRRRIACAMAAELLMDFRRGRNGPSVLLNPLLPIAYWLITILFNVFPLPRLGGFRRSFEHAGQALDRGYSVIIFPEGRRSATGTLLPFRSGIGLLAQEAEAAVLPVALVGIDRILQTDRRWFHSGRITVRVGEPIAYDPQSTPEQTTRRLQAAIAKLSASAQ